MPAVTARSAYTEAEDAHLVEYIAMFGSEKGRKGTKLYNEMVQNLTGRTAWAASHPWQSWRDRYVKNSEYFDKRIRMFQKKHGLWKPGTTEGSATKEVKQEEEVKKRKRVSNTSQDEPVTSKKARVVKKADTKGKGKEVAAQDDQELHLFVAFSKIPPRRRGKAEIDRTEDDGRQPASSTSTADTSRKSSPRRVARATKSAENRPALSKQIETRTALSISQTPHQQGKSTTANQSSKTVIIAEPVGTRQAPETKSPSPASQIGNEEALHDSQSPLFTQHVENVDSGSPLFTQAVKDDGNMTMGSRRESDGEDDSAVNHLLVDPPKKQAGDEELDLVYPPESQEDKEGTVVTSSRKSNDEESDEEYPQLRPLLDSPVQSVATSKSSGHPSTTKNSREPSTSKPQADSTAPSKAKSKQPPKFVEGPYRSQLVGPNPPKANTEDVDSDAAEDLIPQVPSKKAVKKPVANKAQPSTSKSIRKRAISERSSSSSSSTSTEGTPTPPRKKPRSARIASSKNVVLSSERDEDMDTKGHDEGEDENVGAQNGGASRAQKSEPETDEEVEEDEEDEEAATEVEDDDEVHPFDTVSQPPRTPKPDRHPFDMSQSQMFSHSSIRSHVSERDMERVIKTLEKFISKLDTDRRERLLDRSQLSYGKAIMDRTGADEGGPGEEEGESDDVEEEEEEEEEEEVEEAMVLDEDAPKPQPKLLAAVPKGKEREHASNLRERGSPLPTRISKTITVGSSQIKSTDSGGPPQSSGELPPSSSPPAQPSEHGDQDEDESMDVDEAQDAIERSVSPDEGATETHQVEEHEPTREGEKQIVHDSLFSSSETSEETQRQLLRAMDKGKARATDPPVLLTNEEGLPNRRHTIAMANEEHEPATLDLRRLVLARRRSLPSRSSTSSISVGHSAAQWIPSSSRRTSFEFEKPLRMRLSEVDQTKLIEMNVERMALQYGLPASLVLSVWNDCGSLDEAENILSELGSTLVSLMEKSKRRRASVGLDVSLPLSRTGTPQDMTRMEDSGLYSAGQKSALSTIQIRDRSTASPSRPTQPKRDSPQFKPKLVDDDEIPESDYSPPVASRAGKFTRLSRQGRFEEALERETRRASGGKSLLKGARS